MADGASTDWMQEFANEATGLATTFGPAVIGFAAVLDNLSAFWSDTPRPAVVTATALGYVLLWSFWPAASSIGTPAESVDRTAMDFSRHAGSTFRRWSGWALSRRRFTGSCSGGSTPGCWTMMYEHLMARTSTPSAPLSEFAVLLRQCSFRSG